MFWLKEVIILRIGIKQSKVKKSHTSQSHSATVQWKRNASHIMTYIFKIYKHYSFCFLYTDYTTRTLHLEMRSVLFNFIQIYSVWKCNLDFHIAKPKLNVRSFSVSLSENNHQPSKIIKDMSLTSLHHDLFHEQSKSRLHSASWGRELWGKYFT